MKIDKDVNKNIKYQHNKGATAKEIHRQLNTKRSLRTVQRDLKPSNDEKKSDRKEEIRELLKQRKTQAEIARWFNISQPAIYHKIKRYGLRHLVDKNNEIKRIEDKQIIPDKIQQIVENNIPNPVIERHRLKKMVDMKVREEGVCADIEIASSIIQIYINYLLKLGKIDYHYEFQKDVKESLILKMTELINRQMGLVQHAEFGYKQLQKTIHGLDNIIRNNSRIDEISGTIMRLELYVDKYRELILKFDKMVTKYRTKKAK